MPVTVEVEPGLASISTASASAIVQTVMVQEAHTISDITIIFSGDELLNNLKKDFFNQDHFTDVIAFRLNDYAEQEVEGEVYISFSRARENAETYGEPLNRELGRLIIHGGLHLLGYKDVTEEEKGEMTARENHYLDQVNWKNIHE